MMAGWQAARASRDPTWFHSHRKAASQINVPGITVYELVEFTFDARGSCT